MIGFKNISKTFCDNILTKCENNKGKYILRKRVSNFIDNMLNESTSSLEIKEISHNFFEKIFNICVVKQMQINCKKSVIMQQRESIKDASKKFINKIFQSCETINEEKVIRKLVISFIDDILNKKKLEYERNTPLKKDIIKSTNKKIIKSSNFNMPLKILDSLKNTEFYSETEPRTKSEHNLKKETRIFINSLTPIRSETLPPEISPKVNSINKINTFEGKYINDNHEKIIEDINNIEDNFITFYSLKDQNIIEHHEPIRVKCKAVRKPENIPSANSFEIDKDVDDKAHINYPCVRKNLFKNMNDVNINHGLENEVFSEDNKLKSNNKVNNINLALQVRS
jgi:hypothetical protein